MEIWGCSSLLHPHIFHALAFRTNWASAAACPTNVLWSWHTSSHIYYYIIHSKISAIIGLASLADARRSVMLAARWCSPLGNNHILGIHNAKTHAQGKHVCSCILFVWAFWLHCFDLLSCPDLNYMQQVVQVQAAAPQVCLTPIFGPPKKLLASQSCDILSWRAT